MLYQRGEAMSKSTLSNKMEQAVKSDLFSNVLFNNEELNEIVNKAGFLIVNCDKSYISDEDSIFITIAIVNLSKQYGGDDSRFWEYIFKCLLLPQKPTYQNYIYAAIEHLYSDYLKRELYLTQTGRTSYYSTILAHALAPKDTIMSLFNLLYYTYKESLKEVYIKNDSVTRLIASRLKGVLEHSETNTRDILKIDSLQYVIRSSIRYLIFYEINIFVQIIDNVFSYIDGQEINTDFVYLNILLDEWSKKEKVDRRLAVQRRSRTREQFTSFPNLKPKYQIIDDNLILVVPNIHLDKDYHSSFRCDYSYCDIERHMDLYTFGNALVKNIKSFNITILDKYLKINEEVNLNIKIFNGTELLYDSGKSLCFTSVLFKDNVQVKGYVIKPGFYTAYTTLQDEADKNSDLVYKFRNTYTFTISDDSEIRLGDDLWSTGSESEKQDILVRVNKVPNLYYIDEKNNDIEAILGFKSIKVITHNLESMHSLRVNINNDEFFDIELTENHNIIEMTDFPHFLDSFGVKRIAIVNNITQERLIIRNFFVIPDCKIEYSQPIFYGAKCSVKINNIIYRVKDSGPLFLGIENDKFRLELPFLSWSWGEYQHQISGIDDIIWIGDITAASPLAVDLPSRFFDDAMIKIDNVFFKRDKSGYFPLGEILSQFSNSNRQFISVDARVNETNQEFSMFRVYCHEQFVSEPCLYKENTTISWDVTDCYVGSKESRFRVKMVNDANNYEFEFGICDEVEYSEFVDGLYDIEVFRVSEDVFSGNDVLLYREKELLVGDENINRFRSHNILIYKAQLADSSRKTVKLPEYLVTSIEYIENNGFPEYRGQLRCTKDKSTLFKVRITIKDNHVLWMKRENNGELDNVNIDTSRSQLTVKCENDNNIASVNFYYYKENQNV